MSWSLHGGYIPRTNEEVDAVLTAAFNEQFKGALKAPLTVAQYVGSNYAKYNYGAKQLVMQAEANFAELTAKLIEYFRVSNQKILNSRGTYDGFMTYLSLPESEIEADASFRPIEDELHAGCVDLAVDLDPMDREYPKKSELVFEYMHRFLGAALYYFRSVDSNPGRNYKGEWSGAGIHYDEKNVVFNSGYFTCIQAHTSSASTQPGTTGAENFWQEVAASQLFTKGTHQGVNGQSFDYGFHLPFKVQIGVRAKTGEEIPTNITVVISKNTNEYIMTGEEIKMKFLENFARDMKLGMNFEPTQLLQVGRDLPFASKVIIEWGDDGGWQNQPDQARSAQGGSTASQTKGGIRTALFDEKTLPPDIDSINVAFVNEE